MVVVVVVVLVVDAASFNDAIVTNVVVVRLGIVLLQSPS